MTSAKISTQDCLNAISAWHQDKSLDSPGSFKRTKKSKDVLGRVVREFECNTPDEPVLLKVIEEPSGLSVVSLNDQPGHGCLFGFVPAEDLMDGDVEFMIADAAFYAKTKRIECEHFARTHLLPAIFNETMESYFVSEVSEQNTRRVLLDLGFVEDSSLMAPDESHTTSVIKSSGP